MYAYIILTILIDITFSITYLTVSLPSIYDWHLLLSPRFFHSFVYLFVYDVVFTHVYDLFLYISLSSFLYTRHHQTFSGSSL